LKNADATIIRLAAAGEEAQAVEAQNLKSNLETQLRTEEAKLADMRRGRAAEGERETRAAAGGEREERRPIPPEARRNLELWYDRNPWFDADNPDTKSRVAMALDADVMADGFDPTDPEYYRELDRRIADYLPGVSRRRGRGRDDERGGDREERRGREDDRDTRERDDRNRDRDDDRRGGDRDRQRSGGGRDPKGPVFRVGGRDRPLKENEIYLSKERRQALEEMGVMDDPVLRNRYFKSFKKYDEEHSKDASRRNR
jgi:hypothetical protein